MAYNEDSSASGHDEPWIQWFCGLKGHEMFCEVERSYIEDGFNLYGLRACVSNFSDCLDLILDRIGPDDSDDSHLTQSACTLYGLIHARYVITAHGLDAMYNKYAKKEFGTCPLVQCAGQPVLPVGLKDEMGADTVKIYCPKCQCVYHPPPVRSRSSHHGGAGAAGVDGAAFGTTFPHLFLMTFSNLMPDPHASDSAYVPRVFGFRVHQSARQRASSSVSGYSVSLRQREAMESSRQLAAAASAAKRVGDAVASNRSGDKKDDSGTKDSVDQDASGPDNDEQGEPSARIRRSGSGQSKGGQSANDNVSNNMDEESSRKSKSGKRRNSDDASANKAESNGHSGDHPPKRRRRPDSAA